MKSLIYLSSLFTLIASCTIVGAGQFQQSYILLSQERKTQGADEVIYTAEEVDVKAKITNKMENIPKEGGDCTRQGKVSLRIILHKSGKVTGVTIIKGMGCSYDEATVEVARKFKFTPAVKDGQQVSQYQMFEYRYGDQ
jgi:TonB family protein